MLLLVLISLPMLQGAETNGTSGLPTSSLRPPRGEIFPSAWERFGDWMIVGGVLVLGIIAWLTWWVTRPKPTPPVPVTVQARQELETLREQPENPILLSRTSQILKRCLAGMFGLPAGELTTTEFREASLQAPHAGPELSAEVNEFLRACDEQKFAPTRRGPPLRAVDRALVIIEHAEKRLSELERLKLQETLAQNHGEPTRQSRGT